MIDINALRVLYVDTKDVAPEVFDEAMKHINCKKEDLKFISYDFFDNYGVGIITDKQIVITLRLYNKQIITRKMNIENLGVVGVMSIEGRNSIVLNNSNTGAIINMPTYTDKYMFEIVNYLFQIVKKKYSKNEFDFKNYLKKTNRDEAAI